MDYCGAILGVYRVTRWLGLTRIIIQGKPFHRTFDVGYKCSIAKCCLSVAFFIFTLLDLYYHYNNTTKLRSIIKAVSQVRRKKSNFGNYSF